MVFFSFGNRAFNKEYCESNIYMLISPQNKYADPLAFLNAAIKYIDEKVYPGEGFSWDYEGISLKRGEYKDIVERWILSMDQSVEINMDEIIEIQRITCSTSDPLRDEYLIKTEDEYIMFLWSTTA